jgi:hypothetical protein
MMISTGRMALSGMALPLMLIAGIATACPPPLAPPRQNVGETADAYTSRLNAWEDARKRESDVALLKQQSDYWTRSTSVLVARIDHIEPLGKNGVYRLFRATLTPISSIKGARLTRPFTLKDTGATDCGTYGAGDATTGKPGELVIVYLDDGKPGNATLITAITPLWVRDPRVRDALPR